MRTIEFDNLVDSNGDTIVIEVDDDFDMNRLEEVRQRRVFYIDVGKMPPHKAKQKLESIKNELQKMLK